jgi:hypothetical protein
MEQWIKYTYIVIAKHNSYPQENRVNLASPMAKCKLPKSEWDEWKSISLQDFIWRVHNG